MYGKSVWYSISTPKLFKGIPGGTKLTSNCPVNPLPASHSQSSKLFPCHVQQLPYCYEYSVKQIHLKHCYSEIEFIIMTYRGCLIPQEGIYFKAFLSPTLPEGLCMVPIASNLLITPGTGQHCKFTDFNLQIESAGYNNNTLIFYICIC